MLKLERKQTPFIHARLAHKGIQELKEAENEKALTPGFFCRTRSFLPYTTTTLFN